MSDTETERHRIWSGTVWTETSVPPCLLKENCNAKTSWFHMKERSKCWRTICISLELVKPFSSYWALKLGQGITKGESPYFRNFRTSSVIWGSFHWKWRHIWQVTISKYWKLRYFLSHVRYELGTWRSGRKTKWLSCFENFRIISVAMTT